MAAPAHCAGMIALSDSRIAAQGDVDVLARTIWAEARAETSVGQTAVAYCIKHRAELAKAFVAAHGKTHPIYGDGSIVSACLSSFKGIHQFSCWNASDPNRTKAQLVDHSDPVFCGITAIARDVISGKAEDRLAGTTHYYNPSVVPMPTWAKGLPYHSIGAHRFFRNVP